MLYKSQFFHLKRQKEQLRPKQHDLITLPDLSCHHTNQLLNYMLTGHFEVSAGSVEGTDLNEHPAACTDPTVTLPSNGNSEELIEQLS